MGKRLKITAIVIVFAAFCLIGCTVSFKYESVIKAARARGIKPVVLTVFEKYQKSGEFEGVDAEKSREEIAAEIAEKVLARLAEMED